ncbi:class I SAM-dependent DNA methyltransferase [Geodermatophilus sp. SYSU D01045]
MHDDGDGRVAQAGALSALEAVRAWRAFANGIRVNPASGPAISWTSYLKKYPHGRADERTTVGPTVFPAFAQTVLGFEVGQTLAAEVSGPEGRPDFTPADAVTHPFVFEVKGTDGGVQLVGHEAQVGRYLREGRPRITRVVLTNLAGLRVFELDGDGQTVRCVQEIDLRALALIPTDKQAADRPDAQRLADFLNAHRRRELSLPEKIQRVREAAPWNPSLEITSPDWVLTRLDSVVQSIHADVAKQVDAGALLDQNIVPLSDRPLLEKELRELDKRLGSPDKAASARSLEDYLNAGPRSEPGLAVQQFVAHTAFYTATRLLLVRAWEDSGLIEPALHDGGFDKMLAALSNVTEVVEVAYQRAKGKYPELFGRHNAFSWYTPGEDVYVNAIYELANTYLGDLGDDVLGDVYQRQLARVDRKQLGQYYTPRDIIKLIWDLVDDGSLTEAAEAEGRPLRVLDIATGSGGFLVEGAARRRRHFQEAKAAGALEDTREWLSEVTDGFVGCEIQQFSAYLAEVNLVLQFSPLLQGDSTLRLPGLRIHCTDTLTLHNPEAPGTVAQTTDTAVDEGGLEDRATASERQDSIERVRDPQSSGEWLDVAVGNPPYVGEKSIAKTLEALRQQHPYWQQFSAAHVDYLYNFLILGVSKLRKGGRFGFITTEYWLKAEGAAPLRKFLAEHTRIDRLILFRRMTLFPDAPGQHNLIVIGERVTDPEDPTSTPSPRGNPWVSIYIGEARRDDRTAVLDAIRTHANRPSTAFVQSFRARIDPTSLGGASWAEVIMTSQQLSRRRAIQKLAPKAEMVMSEGVIAPPQAFRQKHASDVSAAVLAEIGGPDSRAGIFVLSEEERQALSKDSGGFTPEELAHLKRVINTSDVFPYAAVLPDDAPTLIWLPGSHGGPTGEFPANMPVLEAHLERFKPLLEKTVKGYFKGRMGRPWWSAHSPRTHLVEGHPATAGWADLAVTTRWGDRKLLTALAPAGSLPLSGLHAVTGESGATAAYLVGLINSSPIQELAEALAPGSVGQGDIEALGLPRFAAPVVVDIEARTRVLADLVQDMVRNQAKVWPNLVNVLSVDLSLMGPVAAGWIPTSGRRWGNIASVLWVAAEQVGRAMGVVEEVEREDDLFGRHLAVRFTRGVVHLSLQGDLDPDVSDRAFEVLEAIARGVQLRRGSVDDLLATPVPLSVTGLLATYEDDLKAVKMVVEAYQENRKAIDVAVESALGT